jgi:glucokinase
MLLAGDIGGTKTVLALYNETSQPTAPLEEQRYPSGQYDSLEQIVGEFLKGRTEGVRWGSFGVAGPVVGGKASLPNLPWVIEEAALKQRFDLEAVSLLNDLEAIAQAVPVLPPEDLETVKEGNTVPHGNMAVVAPGTGLGEAYLTWDGRNYQAHSSEGGHGDFAPVDGFQIGLLDYLLERFDHVSYERVCSGTGLPNIYAYIRDRGLAEEPAWLSEGLKNAKDPNIVIMNAAGGEQKCRIATMTIEVFVAILAAEAGNMVLRNMATGGLFLGGGIPPRIMPYLKRSAFTDRFISKGRLTRLPQNVPVRVILNAKAPLVGAACYGLQQLPG